MSFAPTENWGWRALPHTPDEFVAAAEQAMAADMGLKWRERADEFLETALVGFSLGRHEPSDRRALNEAADVAMPGCAPREARALQNQEERHVFDYLIVGAGFSGAVVAAQMARNFGKKVMLVDRRPHVGGNAYDHYDQNGILVHKYGPHIFHTNSKDVFDYLSLFTEWRNYEHRVLASVDGKLVPIPINLDTVNALHGLN